MVLIYKFQIHFVDQRAWIERMIGAFMAQKSRCHLLKIGINMRKKNANLRSVPVRYLLKDFGNPTRHLEELY